MVFSSGLNAIKRDLFFETPNLSTLRSLIYQIYSFNRIKIELRNINQVGPFERIMKINFRIKRDKVRIVNNNQLSLIH